MLDNIDKLIIEELSKNSRITMKKLGERVHLTGQAAASRVLKLEESGIIEKYTVTINQAKLNCLIHAFITIRLNNPYHQSFLSFIKTQEHYILNTYKVSGDGCYILESRFPSNEVLDQFLVSLNEYANYNLSIVINKQN
ncbi:HTH-type transcriptional regulator LrpA [Paenibacillus albidus]|uniref:HTH-type transcriptional regulator LrpA n=1 Tax=Paenibacillus albidus TaxID=2041023 RepID=A0A917FN77_9BACL|nr:Lrp/AsnC family transcriptional regulator [Paenibacillus albidus]GGF91084.1 HTH-type transcriptional regulator LrpA [Paenibacillus albidus]